MPTAAPVAAGGDSDPTASRDDDLGARARRRRTVAWMVGLSCALVVTMTTAVAVGAGGVSPTTAAAIVSRHLFAVPAEVDWTVPQDSIVWQVRLPRAILAAVVGAGLAASGVALQAMVRNVLADPYLLGINSGASTGAAAAILFGVGAGFGEYALSLSAFFGAFASSVVVFLVARAAGRVTSLRLLLAGVAVGYALYAATSFLIFASGSAEGARSVLFWLLGSLGLARWSGPLAVAVVVIVAALVLLTLYGRRLDVLAIGDETARTLGLAPDRFRVQLLIVVALCVGVSVAVSGSIGFVGLVVPHLARRFVGATHRRVIPAAALVGAIFLIWTDVAARTVLQPQEVPIGIITSLVGAPFLLVLVHRFRAGAQ